MWFFRNKTSVKNVARDDEDENDICKEELPSFAPKIVVDTPALAEEPVMELPEDDFQEEQSLPLNDDLLDDDSYSYPRSEYSEMPLSVQSQPQEQDPPKDPEKEEPEELYDEGQSPAQRYEQAMKQPYTARRYGLTDQGMKLVTLDGNGGLYLFEEFGDYMVASPDACSGYIRVIGIMGVFKGKEYRTTELEYVLKERAWPLLVVAKNKEQYRNAMAEGYQPYKRSSDGKGIVMVKPISLYRMKDLALKVEITYPSPVVQSQMYYISVNRAMLEGAEGEKQFKKLLQTVLEKMPDRAQQFFRVQVLKVRKNIAVCFPMEGNPQVGDHFAEGMITAVAPAGDGTVLLQVGNDQTEVLPLAEGTEERGQHRITLEM